MILRNPNTGLQSAGRRLGRGLLWALAIVVAMFVLSPFTIVPNGHRGVKLTFGKAVIYMTNHEE